MREITHQIITVIYLIGVCFSGVVFAKVDVELAGKLGGELTYAGAETKANANGEIPAYAGGLPEPPACFVAGKGLCNPFPDDKIKFTINQENVERYKDNLSLGQIAMIKKYDTFHINVYQTRRTAIHPEFVKLATKINATQANMADGGSGLQNFDAKGFPFPVPQNGLEVIWNHIVRYRGKSLRRLTGQAAPLSNGKYSIVLFEDQVAFSAFLGDTGQGDKDSNVLFYFKQKLIAPARLAGSVLLVHETIDQLAEPRKAWLYNSGQRRVRRAPQVAYDGAATASDGLRTVDNYDMYNGSPDRYDWKLLGKQEMYIPYNSYKLDEKGLSYDEIIKPGHINSDLARYELHRVWVVEATVKTGVRHIYNKRVMYIDEDSWQVAVVDLYDGRGNLWRVQEAYEMQFYGQKIPWIALEGLYDLQNSRYIALGLENNETRSYEFDLEFSRNEYKPASLRRDGIR